VRSGPFVLALATFAALPGTASPAPSLPPARGDVIAVRFAGELPNQQADSSTFFSVFSGNLLSPQGEVVGTFTHMANCSVKAPPPCLVSDVTDIFDFEDGRIVNQGEMSAAPDVQHPGQLLVGVHPPESRMTRATGAYAGRTGRIHMSGRHDCSQCPYFVTFDDFWLIELDSR
jgi:hypothetical protein